MNRSRVKIIFVFILGMLTFAVGSFVVSTFIFVERPTKDGIIEDWEQICFWPDEGGIYATVSPKGCYSSTCTNTKLQAGTATVDVRDYSIQLETRFVLVEASPFPIPCVEDCAGGGVVQFNLGNLIPSDYEVGFRGNKVGVLKIYSGRPTPRQCFEKIE